MAPSITGTALSDAQKVVGTLRTEWQKNGTGVVLLPVTASKDDYDNLILVVNDSASKNENIADLNKRVKALSKSIQKLAKTLQII